MPSFDVIEVAPLAGDAEFIARRVDVIESAAGEQPDGTPPSVTVISPAVGSAIGAFTPITLEVTDNAGQLLRCIVTADLSGTDFQEVVYDGQNFGKKYRGQNNQVTAIANGIRLTVVRDGGWPGSPVFWAEAFDRSGNENA